jgi:soluble lytic murein transglycosylase-like protein
MRYQKERPFFGSPREGVQEMLRSRGIQMVLVGVVAAQVVNVVSRPAEEQLAVLDTVVAEQPAAIQAERTNDVASAWTASALVRESERVAAKYRSQGFRIPVELERKIHTAALEFEIDPAVAFGLIRAESSFRNTATSPVGAVGLTQLMPRTAAWMEPGVTRAQLRDPETNLRIGFKYLRYLLDKYDGDENLALLAYNRGPGTVDRALRRGQNPDNGYAKFVRGEANHGHRLFTR